MSHESILQVIASTQRRGAEVFAVQLAAGLQQRGWRLSTTALTNAGLPALDVQALGDGNPRSPRVLRALRRRSAAAELVIAHGSSTLPMSALATAGTATPFVYRSIGDPAFWASSRARRLRTGAFLRRAGAVVVVWGGAADLLTDIHGVQRSRIHVIPNGVPSASFAPIDTAGRRDARRRIGLDDAEPIILFLGALSPEKNPGAAVDAVAANEHGHLLIAGDGPQRAEIERHAATMLPGRHSMLGSVADPSSVLAAADLVVLTSRTEGCPAALIEAGLSGLPVVATDVGGVSEVVADGRTGLLVPPDRPDALAAAIRDALGHPNGMGAAAREHCLAQFELARITDMWSTLLTEVVA